MTGDKVFGSDELTPELVRSATFSEEGGRYDAAEVRAFLDRVASSVEVFQSEDAPTALRAEFRRNAEIAQQVLDAGQNASEQLRRQAAEAAEGVLVQAREEAGALRATLESEISQSLSHVDQLRNQFIQDLRDLYDRIGASLYRFEQAAKDAPALSAPPVAHEQPAAQEAPAPPPAAAAPAEPVPAAPAPDPAPVAAPELPENAKPPAWQQLPPEAWSEPAASTPNVPVVAEDPAAAFAVQEDEPLAPGEPLIDLSGMAGGSEAAHVAEHVDTVDEPGASWLEPEPAVQGDELPPLAPQAAAPDAVEAVAAPAPLPGDAGSWLDPGPAQEADPTLEREDALAQMLIGPNDGEDPAAVSPEPEHDLAGAGSVWGDGAAAGAGPAPEALPPAGQPSADAAQVRQLILESLAAGQTREAIETYLRDTMGFVEPGALVDAAIGSAGTPG